MTRARLANVLRNIADDYDEEAIYEADETLKQTARNLRAEADAVERSSMSDGDAEAEIHKVAAKYRLN